MAEIFGAVASGAGLVSLSIQLLDSARKLKVFYDASRHAPETVRQLYFDLETMSLTLLQLEQCRQNDISGSELLSRCIMTCDQAVVKINTAVDKMDNLLNKSRFVGRLYSGFREPEMTSLLEVLEHAKSSMFMAYTIYCQHWHVRQATQHLTAFALQKQRIESLQNVVESSNTALMRLMTTSAVRAESSDLFPSAATETSGRPFPVSGRRNKTFKCRVALPRWFATRVWELMVSKSNQVWTIQLIPTSVRPKDTPAFDPVFDGNVETVRDLVMRGKLSIHDQTEIWDRPWTLLEMAAHRGNIELCKFLLENAPMLREAAVLRSALWKIRFFASVPFERPNIKLMDEVYSLFVGTYGLEIDLREVSLPHHHVVLCHTKASVETIIVNQDVALAELAPKQRFQEVIQFNGLPAETFTALLLHNTGSEPATDSASSGKTAFHWAAAHFGEWLRERYQALQGSSGNYPSHRAESYQKLASELVAMGADVHALWKREQPTQKPWITKSPRISPLISFLAGIYEGWFFWDRPGLSYALSQWGEMLTQGGCALPGYVTSENQYLRTSHHTLGSSGSWQFEIAKLTLSSDSRLTIEVKDITHVTVFKVWPIMIPGAWPSSWPSHIPETLCWHPRSKDEQDGFQWVEDRKFCIKSQNQYQVGPSSTTSDMDLPLRAYPMLYSSLLDESKDDHDINVLGRSSRAERNREHKIRRRTESVPSVSRVRYLRHWGGCRDECAAWLLHKHAFCKVSSLRGFMQDGDDFLAWSRDRIIGWQEWLVESEEHIAVANHYAERFAPELMDIVEGTASRAAERARLEMGPQWNGDTNTYLRRGYGETSRDSLDDFQDIRRQ